MNSEQKKLIEEQSSSKIQNYPTTGSNINPSFTSFAPQPQVQIIDCYMEVSKKNYLPFILAVTENQFENINALDEHGYNALHYAASQGNIPIAKILIEELKLDVQCLSKNLQSPLMLAANAGCTELAHYFCQIISEEQLNIKDSCGFNNLIYTAKSDYIPLFLYFVNKGVDINVKDNSGCSIAHWAAYQNHLNMLKLISRISGILNQKDNDQKIPLNRASENCSLKAVKYINQQLNQMFLDSRSLNSRSQTFKLFYSSLIYICLSIFFYFQFWQYLKEKTSYFGTLFTIIFFYFQAIFFYFIIKGKYVASNDYPSSSFVKSNDQIKKQAAKEGFTEIDPEILKHIDFSKINEALNLQSQENIFNYIHYTICYVSFYKFTILILNKMEQKLFKEIDNIDFSRYCSTCLKFMPPQAHHCKQTNTCIKHYSHFSHFFGRIINNQNHLLYYSLIGLQEILMILFIYCFKYSFGKAFTSYYVLNYFEIAYLSYLNNGFLNFLSYCLISYLLVINSYYFILETAGILQNQTRNEIFNRYKYRYLYNPVLSQSKNIWNFYTNSLNLEISQNIRNYLFFAQKN